MVESCFESDWHSAASMSMNDVHPPLDRRRAIVALVLVNAMWGSSFPVMKCLNLQIDQHFAVTELTASSWLRSGSAAWMIAIRFAIALLLLAFVLRGMMRQIRLPHVLSGMAIGTVFFVGLLLQVIGLATIPASRSGFLTSLAVVFTPLITTIFRRRLPGGPSLLGAAIALLGVTVLTGLLVVQDGRVAFAEDAWQRWTTGDSLTTLAAFFFSVQILLVDRLGKRYESVAFTPSMFATTAVLASIVFLVIRVRIPEVPASAPSAGVWFSLAVQPRFFLSIGLLSVFPTLLAFVLMNKFQPYLSAVQAAVIYTLEPVFASLWAMFLPTLLAALCAVVYSNEQLSLPLLIGGTLVLIANVLALWPLPVDPPLLARKSG
jgi:drug/metabolite transporter (DMT)-like permease